MKYVEPLKNKDDIKKISNYFKEQHKRNYLLFTLGINTPMRVTQLLNLRVIDVKDKEEITIMIGKRAILFPLGRNVKKIIQDYCKNKSDYDFLFTSIRIKNSIKPITKSQVNKILLKASINCDIDNLGASSLRKTFAYFYYKRTKNIRNLMKLLNHHDQYYTLQYIGENKNIFDNDFLEWEEI